MVEQVKKNTGAEPVQTSSDAGYYSKQNVESTTSSFCENFIPPDRMKHGRESAIALAAVTEREGDDSDLSIADRMRKRLSTPEGREAYAKRKKTVEPVFGQIKGSPGSPGFRQFMRRGLSKARQEWRWICAKNNFLKYIRHGFASQTAK